MYKLDMVQVLNEKNLTNLVDRFKAIDRPKFLKLDRYYKVDNDLISSRHIGDGKPNNKIKHGFARYITNMATSYFIGKPVEYIVDSEDGKGELLEEYLRDYLDDTYNYDYEIAKSASKKGIAYELLYIDKNAMLKAKRCEAEDIIPIYSNTDDEFLNGFVRLRRNTSIDDKLIEEIAEVYDKEYIHIFIRKGGSTNFKFKDSKEHRLSDVPLIVYWNNEECLGDYETVISLIDAYDKAQSNTANDMDYFTDAYLVIKGSQGGLIDEDGENIEFGRADRSLRQRRLLMLDEKGDAKFLTKPQEDAGSENYKNKIFRDIFFTSQVPAMTDESFAGDLSGIALKYKLMGLEQLAIMKENQMRLAKKKKLSMIVSFINKIYSKSFDSNIIRQKYTRNFTENISEIIDNATKLEGLASKKTRLEMLPNDIVINADKELERLEEEAIEDSRIFKEDEHLAIDDGLDSEEADE